jgi:hypothetical protein
MPLRFDSWARWRCTGRAASVLLSIEVQHLSDAGTKSGAFLAGARATDHWSGPASSVALTGHASDVGGMTTLRQTKNLPSSPMMRAFAAGVRANVPTVAAE